MGVSSFSFGAAPSANSGLQYGYDLKQKKWGWGSKGAGGFQLAATSAASGTNTGSKTPAQVITDIINQGTDAVPPGLKALGEQSTNTMTSTTGVGAPIQGASDQTANYISNLVNPQGTGSAAPTVEGGTSSSPAIGAVPSYTGQRVAPLSAPEQQAQTYFQNSMAGSGAGTAGVNTGMESLQRLATGTGGGYEAVRGALGTSDTSGLDTASGPVATQKLTDVDMTGYINPAQNAMYDAILRGGDIQKNAIRGRQARAGAFGENSSVAQSLADDSTKRNLSLAGADAFKIAQAAAMGDVSAENAGRQSNRTAAMTAAAQKLSAGLTDKQRALMGGQAINADMMAGATGAANVGTTLHNMGQQSATGAAGAGATARSITQAGHDAGWEQYLQKLGYGLNVAQVASGALGQLPGQRTTATTQLGPSPAGQQVGALIGLTGLQQQYSTNTSGSLFR